MSERIRPGRQRSTRDPFRQKPDQTPEDGQNLGAVRRQDAAAEPTSVGGCTHEHEPPPLPGDFIWLLRWRVFTHTSPAGGGRSRDPAAPVVLINSWLIGGLLNPGSVVSPRREAVKVLGRNVSTGSLAARPRLGFRARTADCVSVAETPSLPTSHWTLAEDPNCLQQRIWSRFLTNQRRGIFFLFVLTLARRRHA